MANLCCMTGCTAESSRDLYYFKLPTKPALRRRWLDVIKPMSRLGLDASVCSAHFAATDYETVRGKTRLKKNKVPMNVDESKSQSDQTNQSNCSLQPENKDQEDPVDRNHKENAEGKVAVEENGVKEEIDNKENGVGEEEREDSKSGLNDVVGDREISEKETAETNGQEMDCGDPNSIEIQITPDIIEDYNTLQVTPDIIEGYDALKPPDPLDPDINDDIEDILTNYHIMNPPSRRDRELASRPPSEPPSEKPDEKSCENPSEKPCEKPMETPNEKPMEEPSEKPMEDCSEKSSEKPAEVVSEKPMEKSSGGDEIHTIDDDDDDLPFGVSSKPVFIEIPVDKDRNQESSGDCLMVLESLQVSIDPDSLLLPERPEPHEIEIHDIESDDDTDNRNHDPISLLTSSDEDEVIIEEPHIDTVEVSDETDEDDVPLVRLVKPRKSLPDVAKIFWGAHEYYCTYCTFCTFSPSLYKSHLKTHTTTALQICQICGFTTASEYQFARHKKKHKEERRFKCHLCDYKARHNMSLIYHLRTHDTGKKSAPYYRCDKCSFKTNVKSKAMKHIRSCNAPKVYKCDKCKYVTKRNSDLKRHRMRRHPDSDGEGGSIYGN